MEPTNYIALNRQNWNNRVDGHLSSEFYDMKSFRTGENSLKEIELNLLGNVSGKKILHLQCHFGQDTLSLARMGAQVTGIDFSDKAIEEAKKLSTELQLNARFICCDIYDAPQHLDEKFDIVYTTYGTIGWLPDVQKWADVIAQFLNPNGQLIFVDFHPVVWMFDDDFKHIIYNYFQENPIIEEISGSYANKDLEITDTTITWNHGLSEVYQALQQAGLSIQHFSEYPFSPYNCLRNMIESEPNRFQIEHLQNKIPMVYALTAHPKAQ
ncbi:MAG: class I SAM-dependent methyltransferase [Flavobacteriales bacterium]